MQFELPDQTRDAVGAWIGHGRLGGKGLSVSSARKPHLFDAAVWPYRRAVVSSIGLDPKRYGTHSMRRTKGLIYTRRQGTCAAVQLLLGHKSGEHVQYLGIEVDDALAISEQIEL